MCVGHPLIRIQELLALIKSGIVEILYQVKVEQADKQGFKLKDFFDNIYYGDKIINAQIGDFMIEYPVFLNSIIKNDLSTKFKNANLQLECFTIDENFQSINSDNEIIKNLFILGLPTDGIKFYTFILPRPYIHSTFLSDSNTAINTFLKN